MPQPVALELFDEELEELEESSFFSSFFSSFCSDVVDCVWSCLFSVCEQPDKMPTLKADVTSSTKIAVKNLLMLELRFI